MPFESLCQKCPIQKMCTLPCKIFEVDKCDTYDYAVVKLRNHRKLRTTQQGMPETQDIKD
jgi:hypothetical protein